MATMKRLLISASVLAVLAVPTVLVFSATPSKAPENTSTVVTVPTTPVAPVAEPTPEPAPSPVVETPAPEPTQPVVAEVSELDKFWHIRNTIENAIESNKSNTPYYMFINSVLRTYPHENPEKFTYELVEQTVQYILNYYAPAKADMTLANGLFKNFTW